jgi:arylsulfatase A-like enzyme
MGDRTPNIDRIGNEGMRFTDAYGEQSCTAGFGFSPVPSRTPSSPRSSTLPGT